MVKHSLHDAEGMQKMAKNNYLTIYTSKHATENKQSNNYPTGPEARTSLSRSKPLIITYTPLFNGPKCFPLKAQQTILICCLDLQHIQTHKYA